MTRSTLCSICSNTAAKDVVNAALLAGDRPADVVRRYADDLHLSRAAVYRHAAGHLPLVGVYIPVLGDSPRGAVLGDLDDLRRAAIAQTKGAAEAGRHADANRATTNALAISRTLLENDADDEKKVRQHAYFLRFAAAWQGGLFFDPDSGEAAAAGADSLGDRDLAEDIRQTVANARTLLETEPDRKITK